MHGHSDQLDSQRHKGIEVVVERIAEGRGEQHASGWTRLMLIVNDLRKPFPVEHAVDGFGLRLSNHVEVSVVVMSDILLVQTGKSSC